MQYILLINCGYVFSTYYLCSHVARLSHNSKTQWENFLKFGTNVHLSSMMSWSDSGDQVSIAVSSCMAHFYT